MIQAITTLAFFILIIIHGQEVIKSHLCPSLVIDHQVERRISNLFTKNISFDAKKIELKHLKKCKSLIRVDANDSSFSQKRRVHIELKKKLEK